jgi:hypothetical protein
LPRRCILRLPRSPHRRHPLQVHGVKKSRSTRKIHKFSSCIFDIHILQEAPHFSLRLKEPQASPAPQASTTVPYRAFGAAMPSWR